MGEKRIDNFSVSASCPENMACFKGAAPAFEILFHIVFPKRKVFYSLKVEVMIDFHRH
jgi:hypothetical protein